MKAVVYEKYGGPEVLQIKSVEAPIPKPDEVRIRVRAVEVTKADCELRSFRFPVKWFWLPLRAAMGIFNPKKQVLGGYFAGEVESVGREVKTFDVGDRIFGCANFRMGAYAEFLCLPENYPLVAMPETIDFEEAAAVPLGGLNAVHFLSKADIRPASKVLIVGAGGSIGVFALQMAKNQRAHVTVVDGLHKEPLLRSLGADHFIDYRSNDVPPPSEGFDVIVNLVAQSSYTAFLNALKPGGCYLMLNPRLSDMVRSVWTSRLTDKRAVFAFAPESKKDMLKLKAMIAAGEIHSVIDSVMPLEQIATAHRRVQSEQRLGAVVVKVN